MAIVILRNDDMVPRWKKALQLAAPDIPIYAMGEEPSPEAVTMAAVWKHPGFYKLHIRDRQVHYVHN